MNVPDWLRAGGPHKLADRLHFTGRHDDVDPSPGPEKCADTACMTLRALANLAAQDHEALVAAKILFEYHGIESDTITDVNIQAGEDFKKQHE